MARPDRWYVQVWERGKWSSRRTWGPYPWERAKEVESNLRFQATQQGLKVDTRIGRTK